MTVPVVGTGVTTAYLMRRTGPQHAVPGEPYLLPEPHGYFPSAFRPSQVFPPEFFASPPIRSVPGIDYIPFERCSP